jgi:hypothetical protein
MRRYLMPKLIDLSGFHFGRLTVIERAENRVAKNGRQKVVWKCICQCGNLVEVDGTYLRSGETSSCGCLTKDILKARNTSHGESHSRLYRIWKDMKRRCNSPTRYAHEYYHDIGIKVCAEWSEDFQKFKTWALENGYSDKLTIDRIDYNGNYSPDNCRWISMKAQCNNRRSNMYITIGGVTHTLSEWSELSGIKASTIRNRIINLGWDAEQALSVPVERG